jgi:hypothetical protein
MINDIVQRIELDEIKGGYKATIVYRHRKNSPQWLIAELLITQSSLGTSSMVPLITDAMYEVGHLLNLHCLGKGKNNLDFHMMRECNIESCPPLLRPFSTSVEEVEPKINRENDKTFWRAMGYRN